MLNVKQECFERLGIPSGSKAEIVADPARQMPPAFSDNIYVELVACIDPAIRAVKDIDDHLGRAARAKFLIDQIATIQWESVPDGLVETDSAAWRAFTGQSYDDWKGYGWLTALHTEDRVATEEKRRSTVRDQRAVEAEYRLKNQDGCYQWMRVYAVPARDANGQITKWFGIDIALAGSIKPAGAKAGK